MWSGPRNISTAMMRAFENRDDTLVVDEPFYAYYLQKTGLPHPMAEDIIRSQATDWTVVADQMSSAPVDAEVFYQKQMTHHILPDMDMSWTADLQNCFLIRDPISVVKSYSLKMDSISQDDIGIVRQYELYEEIAAITGQYIPVIDAAKFLANPQSGLIQLCDRLGIPFSDKMLSWPKGRRKSDGVWASHWYGAVEQSTGFQSAASATVTLTGPQQKIADEADQYYQLMLAKC